MMTAALHLCFLQYEWVERCHHEGHIQSENYDAITAYLINSRRKLLWTDSFIRVGSNLPPYLSIN